MGELLPEPWPAARVRHREESSWDGKSGIVCLTGGLIKALCVWGVAVRVSGGRELHSQHGVIKMFHFFLVTPGGQGEF